MRIRTPLFALLSLAVAVPGADVQAQAPATLHGTWALDATRSDDAAQKLEQALEAGQQRSLVNPDNDSRAGSVRDRARGRTDNAGAATREAARLNSTTRAPRIAQVTLLDANSVLIELLDGTVVYQIGGQTPVVLRPGRHTMTRWGIAELDVRTEVKDNQLSVDTRGPDNLRVQERYELKNGVLEAQITADLPGVSRSVRVKRVYTAGTQ